MATSLTTSYVKLAVPGNKNGDDSHVIRQEKLLIKRFNTAQFQVKLDGERLDISNDHEDPFYETTFQIQSENGFKYDFLDTIMDFQYDLCDQISEPSKRASIILHHIALFDEKLIGTLRDFNVARIAFGNIWNNEFYNHFETCFNSVFGRRQDGGRRNNLSIKNMEVLDTIKAHFEFDKSMPITVDFYIDEELKGPIVNYKLFIDGSSIRQIIVDPEFQITPPNQISSVRRTRMYFVLNAPVVVKKAPLDKVNRPNYINRVLELPWIPCTRYHSNRQALTENKVFCIEYAIRLPTSVLHTILSRFRCRWNIPVEFANFNEFEAMEIPHVFDLFDVELKLNLTKYVSTYPCNVNDHIFLEFLDRSFPLPIGANSIREVDKIKERRFAYTYLIESLLSRGSVVKDQLLLDIRRWYGFLRIILEHIHDDKYSDLCESALEDLLNYVDNQPRVGDLLDVFKRMCVTRQDNKESNQVTKDEWSQGYRKVRKVILTPTRKIYLAPEIIMSNRAVLGADHDGTRIIRASFRDDDMQKMRSNNLRGLLKKIVIDHLERGFRIMGRDYGYLASSCSQMRDGGAYFMERYSARQLREFLERGGELTSAFKPKIIDYRKKLGKFEYTGSIPKAMARIGQCFSQARACHGVEIGVQDYKMIPDAIGGKNMDESPYMYTDGVGMISVKLANEISRSLQIPNTPCAFQIRFRGLKGMLVIDPGIDKTADYFKDLYRRGFMKKETNEETDLAPYTYKCLFRESQLKFLSSAGGKDKWPIELVKWSAPTPVILNRPFINVLDQVSAMQSLESHHRICGRIEEILDIEMDTFSKYIVNEEKCRSRLEDMPRRVHFAALQRKFGFVLSTEPFFRSLIKAAIDVSMMKLLRKAQIPIPSNMGRTMFGVTDETGQLQYGQVFVRYTENMSNKSPSKMCGKTLKGKVMITKFPTLSGGDVRMFEAVDIPELRHLENVVVFPQTGPRSHPDEMAGSDLDGDEYAVIWDPLLFFERNEKAFAYCNDKPNHEFTSEEMDKKMNEFFAEYMNQDDVGVTATNHLELSDQYGINSEVCNNLAKKNAMCLDYSKSGVPPLPLTNKWTVNPDTGINEPPERSERRPDFRWSRFGTKATYTSSRLLGTIHRELRSISDVVVSSAEKQISVVLDELLICKGWELYIQEAGIQMKRYNGKLRSIMDTFGISTEAEVFSGCFREIRNRHSEKEQDDMSMYNTENVIETQMTTLYRKYREEFFEEFVIPDQDIPAYMRCTVPENERRNDEEIDVFRRICKNPSDSMMAKAVAYYRVCYEAAANGGERKLSFGWIAYDILNYVKGKNMLELQTVPTTRLPQFQVICDHRNTYIKDDKSQKQPTFGGFITRITRVQLNNSGEQEREAKEIIFQYILNNLELQKCLFIIDSWARAKELLRDESDLGYVNEVEKEEILRKTSANSLKWYHLALMVIMVATNQLGTLIDENQRNTGSKIFEIIDPNGEKKNEQSRMSESDLDRLTISFFRFLSTREFRRLRCLNFRPIGLKSVFMRGDWLPYHTAATQTYYNLLLNLRFDELQISTEKIGDRISAIREGDPFAVELPRGMDHEDILNRLRKVSNCVEIQGRMLEQGPRVPIDCNTLIISSRGTIEANNELRDFTSVKLPRYQWQLEDSISKPLAHLFYYKIMGEKWVDPNPSPVPYNPKRYNHHDKRKTSAPNLGQYRNSNRGPNRGRNRGPGNINHCHHRSYN